MERENYIVVQGWMVKDLQLKGNELLIFACIHGFTQTDGQSYTGSLQYLADWTNSSKQTVITSLKSLVDKGYLVKKQKEINGVKFPEYHSKNLNGVVKNFERGSQNSLMGGSQNSLPNNIEYNKTIDTPIHKKDIKGIDGLSDDVKTAFLAFMEMRKRIKKPMTDNAICRMVSKLKSLASDEKTQIAILNQSEDNCWQDLYALKNQKQETDKPFGDNIFANIGYMEAHNGTTRGY